MSQDDQHSYSLQKINDFLDEKFGTQFADITDFFPDLLCHETHEKG